MESRARCVCVHATIDEGGHPTITMGNMAKKGRIIREGWKREKDG